MSDYFERVAGRSELVGVLRAPVPPIATRPAAGDADASERIDELPNGEPEVAPRASGSTAFGLVDRAPATPPGRTERPVDREAPIRPSTEPAIPPPHDADRAASVGQTEPAVGRTSNDGAGAQIPSARSPGPDHDPPPPTVARPGTVDRRRIDDELARVDALMYGAAGVPVPTHLPPEPPADPGSGASPAADEAVAVGAGDPAPVTPVPTTPVASADPTERPPPVVAQPAVVPPEPLTSPPTHDPVDRIAIDRVDIAVLAPDRRSPTPPAQPRRPVRAVGRLEGRRADWRSR